MQRSDGVVIRTLQRRSILTFGRGHASRPLAWDASGYRVWTVAQRAASVVSGSPVGQGMGAR
ncbi:MAG: hypothetical protein ACJ74E_08695 [Actinomycetes bacterium]